MSACRRRVGVLMTSFPHVAAVRSRFEAKVQTTLMNNADNGLLWARWSVFWAQRHLVWSVARMWVPEYAGCPLDTHMNPLYRT